MKLKKEPKNIDFVIKSETWSAKDLAYFRKLMNKLKQQNKKDFSRKPKLVEKILAQ